MYRACCFITLCLADSRMLSMSPTAKPTLKKKYEEKWLGGIFCRTIYIHVEQCSILYQVTIQQFSYCEEKQCTDKKPLGIHAKREIPELRHLKWDESDEPHCESDEEHWLRD